jgi:hypothetical protein
VVALNSGRLLVKINRISAWVLLVFMILFFISGYAWWNRILLSLNYAKYIHTNLDIFLVFFFLVHVLISIRFALARWRVGAGHGQMINLLLTIIGIASFAAILSIR